MLLLIADDGLLGCKRLDHSLKGECTDRREYRVGGDFLLINQIEGNFLNFVRGHACGARGHNVAIIESHEALFWGNKAAAFGSLVAASKRAAIECCGPDSKPASGWA